MWKWTELMNLPIISPGRAEVECVKSLVMNAEHTHISALLLDVDNSTRKARVLRISDVYSFRTGEIRVSSPQLIQALDLAPDIRLVLYPHGPMSPTRLHSRDGCVLGQVRDLSFEEETGRIHWLEIAREEDEAFSEHSRLPLHEELQDGIVTHASVLRQPAAVTFELVDKAICSQ